MSPKPGSTTLPGQPEFPRFLPHLLLSLKKMPKASSILFNHKALVNQTLLLLQTQSCSTSSWPIWVLIQPSRTLSHPSQPNKAYLRSWWRKQMLGQSSLMKNSRLPKRCPRPLKRCPRISMRCSTSKPTTAATRPPREPSQSLSTPSSTTFKQLIEV